MILVPSVSKSSKHHQELRFNRKKCFNALKCCCPRTLVPVTGFWLESSQFVYAETPVPVHHTGPVGLKVLQTSPTVLEINRKKCFNVLIWSFPSKLAAVTGFWLESSQFEFAPVPVHHTGPIGLKVLQPRSQTSPKGSNLTEKCVLMS